MSPRARTTATRRYSASARAVAGGWRYAGSPAVIRSMKVASTLCPRRTSAGARRAAYIRTRPGMGAPRDHRRSHDHHIVRVQSALDLLDPAVPVRVGPARVEHV